MNKIIPDNEKEKIIDLTYSAVRGGLVNGDYQDIDIKIKSIIRSFLQPLDQNARIYMIREFIVYIRRRIKVPGGRLGAVALINVGRIKGVPSFLLEGATSIWGTLFSSKANSTKMLNLILD